MSNYYADINATGDETTPVIRMHLGKMSRNSTSIDGNLFPSFKSMQEFLTHNKENVTITSETGIEYSAEEFSKMVYASTLAERRCQYNWVMNAGIAKDQTWLDAEGFSMSKGSWS